MLRFFFKNTIETIIFSIDALFFKQKAVSSHHENENSVEKSCSFRHYISWTNSYYQVMAYDSRPAAAPVGLGYIFG